MVISQQSLINLHIGIRAFCGSILDVRKWNIGLQVTPCYINPHVSDQSYPLTLVRMAVIRTHVGENVVQRKSLHIFGRNAN